MENLHKKTKANAISSYLLIGINWAFLLNKDNDFINNIFVKSHTKTALTIHIGLLLNLVIFVWHNPLPIIFILGYTLGDIAAIAIFLFLAAMIFIGCYKAHSGEYFYTKDIIKLSGDKKLLDINDDLKINERDKLTLILAHIPFIGAYLYGKYSKYEVVKNIGKLNLLVTSLILFLYITGSNDLANLFSLGYIIYVVFSSINLFVSQKLLQINLDFLSTPTEIRTTLITLLSYLENYFSKQKFINYSQLKKNVIDEETTTSKKLEIQFKTIPENKKIKKYIITIRNISVLIIFSAIILLSSLSNSWLLFILLIALYILGYVKYSLVYKTPFIYDTYAISASIYTKIKSFFIKTKKLHKKEETSTMKVTAK
ncbi:hypothetical protein OAN96_00655 [Candidatus Gracilibacteria bacterium]|nr:hypothetical protein [Candidatus Gracilibacteria bacterium]